MHALTYVEIDIPYCSLAYGAAPCTASIGVTGDDKCFNTFKTCQDEANYAASTVTMRFAVPTAALPTDIDCLPNIKEVSVDPAMISLGEDLGQRASISVRFVDAPDSDTWQGGDKYFADRAYDPYRQGTFWGKFRARQPYLRGSALRLITGVVGQSLDQMDTRHYVIESASGPAIDGVFVVVAKDVLKLADGDRAQAPALSNGYLAADITDVQTTAALSPTGIGDDEYPLSGYIAIGGSEICEFVRWESVLDLTADNDANVKALLHFDVSLIDENYGGAAKTWTASSASVSSSSSKFGGASLSCSTGGVSTPDDADFTLGTSDFTVEFWFNRNGNNGVRGLFGQGNSSLSSVSIAAGFTAGNTIAIYALGGLLFATTGTVTDSNWHHFALVRNGSSFKVYIDGTADATTHTSSSSLTNLSSSWWIGAAGDFSGNKFAGYIDEFRLSVGVARYTANFTPASSAFSTTYSVVSTGDDITISRGVLGTTAAEHKAGDRVQLAIYYAGESPADIIYDLLNTYSNVVAAYIPLATWQSECDLNLGLLYTAVIAEPTAVSTLVAELIEQAALAVWWDDSSQLIRLQVLRNIATDAAVYDDDTILAGTLAVTEQPEKRLSRVQTFFGRANPLRPLTETENYRSSVSYVDDDMEARYGAAAIKQIYSRWIPEGGRATADAANQKFIARFRDPPRKFSFEILRQSLAVEVEAGGGYRLGSRILQTANGSADQVPIQVVQIGRDATRLKVTAEEMLFSGVVDLSHLVVIDVPRNDINLRTLHDLLYPAAVSGDTVTCRIDAGVIVGSSSTSTPALDIGSWASGVIVVLILFGRIEGHGGMGGGKGALDGTSGGKALYTRQAISVEYGADAEIWGGGGGGAAGGGVFAGYPFIVGGGGGAGQSPGDGGTGYAAPDGYDGTTEAGGAARTVGAVSSGAGGGPGLSGSSTTAGSGGSAGSAVDGISYVTVTSGTADVRGSTIN